MPELKKFTQITDLFNGSDDFSKASTQYNYNGIVSEIKNAVANVQHDIIYIGIGAGNPTTTYSGSNPTLNLNVPPGLYDHQCFPEFLKAYKNPLSICVNKSLDLGGKPFAPRVKVVQDGFPLNKVSDAAFPALPDLSTIPVVVLNAVSQTDYPGIVDLAYRLGAVYIKSYGEANLGAVNEYYKFIKGKKVCLKGTINLSLTDASLLEEIEKDAQS